MARRKRRGQRTARSNFYSAGALVNRPRKRRSTRRNPHLRRSARRTARRTSRRMYAHNVYMPMNPRRYKRRYKRNPDAGTRGMTIMGVQLPALTTVFWAGLGFIAPPVLTAQIMKFIPDSLKTNGAVPNWLTWVIKVVSAFVPPMVIRRFVNRRAGNIMLVGAGVSFALDAIRTLAPDTSKWLGLGYQPLLGAYTRQAPGTGRTLPYRQNPRMLPPQISEAPERLSPQARF